jgi:uncharacterized membrane protein
VRRHAPAWAPAVWALVCAGLYAAVSLRRFGQAVAASWDNAIFEEAIRGYAHFGPPIVDIKGPHFNLLGDHFSPVIALLGPVYRLFPDARTLLLAQVVLFALSVYVVSAAAARLLPRWPAVAVSGAYGLSFGLQSALVSDFHEIAFGVPLVALAGAAFVERRFRAVMGWSLPLLLVKEDMGLTVAAIGAALFLRGERHRGVGLAVAGVAGWMLTILVVIPYFRDGTAYAYALGGDGLMANLLAEPGRKSLTLLLTLCIGGLVGALSPWALVAVPTLAWRFAADNPFYWGTDFHYGALLMPVMALAAIDAMRAHRRTVIPGTLVLVGITAGMFGGSPVREYLDPEAWETRSREVAARAVLETVPRQVRVDSDIGLIIHLVTGRQVTFIGTPGNAVPDWVVLDKTISPDEPSAAEYADRRYGHRYERVLQSGPFDVARRVRDESSAGRRGLHPVEPR